MNRKRAQYLLKRYQDFVAHSKLSLDLNIFQDFFLVVETLEEKQIHIIKPVLTKMEKIRDGVLIGKRADPSWLTALYKRILGHENLQVFDFLTRISSNETGLFYISENLLTNCQTIIEF